MGALGVWAIAIGIADLLLPAKSEAAVTRRQLLLGAAALGVAAVVAALGIGMSLVGALAIVVVTVVSGALWLWLGRSGRDRTALAVLASAFVSLLAAGDRWNVRDGALAGALERSAVIPIEPVEAVFVVGMALLLIGTGNRVVRIVLGAVEQGLLRQEQQLKGGRVIGVIERLLIFGLGISGQLVAAGLVVAAKSLLRFSELGDGVQDRAQRNDPGLRPELKSEYLLVGSLLSWALAFIAVGVVAAATG